MKVIPQLMLICAIGTTAMAAEQDMFPKGTVMLSQVVTVPAFNKMQTREIKIPVKPHGENVFPVAVCIEDEKAKLFSPVAIKEIDRKHWTATIVTSHGGKYAVVYISDILSTK